MSFGKTLFIVTLCLFNFLYSKDMQDLNTSNLITPPTLLLGSPNIDDDTTDYKEMIRRNKSSLTLGVGLNYTNLSLDTAKPHYKFNASFLLGYSYFFNKNIGFRTYLMMDNSDKFGLYGAGGDIIYDMYQGRVVGFGIIAGLSGGYMAIYPIKNETFLPYANGGFSISFDSGKSRFEALVRYPLIKPRINNTLVINDITFIAMYSYTF